MKLHQRLVLTAIRAVATISMATVLSAGVDPVQMQRLGLKQEILALQSAPVQSHLEPTKDSEVPG